MAHTTNQTRLEQIQSKHVIGFKQHHRLGPPTTDEKITLLHITVAELLSYLIGEERKSEERKSEPVADDSREEIEDMLSQQAQITESLHEWCNRYMAERRRAKAEAEDFTYPEPGE